jgi:hypothetical protein
MSLLKKWRARGAKSPSEGFFDKYPRFYETSRTGPSRIRNNKRYAALIGANAAILKGARVLDFASHDGRWCFAALQAGATHATGVEPQKALVDMAWENFAFYKVPREKYEFIQEDAITSLRTRSFKADVVFAFGFLTIIAGQPEFFGLIRRFKPSHLILDVQITRDRHPNLRLLTEKVGALNTGVADSSFHKGSIIGAVPSRVGLELMMDHFGYDLREIQWRDYLGGDPTECEDYASGKRSAFVATCRE